MVNRLRACLSQEILIEQPLMMIYQYLMILYFALICLVSAQKYPSCPGGVPIDIGNATDTFYTKILDLTNFMSQGEDNYLTEAFHLYATTGSTVEIDSEIEKNRRFYIIIIVILSTVSFTLLVVMCKIGNIQLTTREIFQKAKDKGFSSPLSTFFGLLGAILIITSCVNAYDIPKMIDSLQMTQCRLDVLNEVYLNGAIDNNWNGINPYAQKIDVANELSANVKTFLDGGFTNQSDTLFYAGSALDRLRQNYLRVYHNYVAAEIGQTSNVESYIKLTTLVPNLFENSTNDQTPIIVGLFQAYLNLLDSSQYLFQDLQNLLSSLQSHLNISVSLLNTISQTLKDSSKQYSSVYSSVRLEIAPFFASSKSMLITCQVITALTIFGSIVALISIRLIQSNYDYFSLKIYKIVWAILLVLFCLNLVFLMIFNQMMLYNKGVCTFSDSLLKNSTYLYQTFPQTKVHQSMHLMSECYSKSNFSEIIHTDSLLNPIFQYVSIKEQIVDYHTPAHLTNYSFIMNNVNESLKQYQFGSKGTYTYMDNQLAIINGYTNGNYREQGCFKHYWQYDADRCHSGEQIKEKPSEITYLYHSNSYSSINSECYILNDFSSSPNPTVLDYNTFTSLYEVRAKECPYMYSVMSTQTVTFFDLLTSRLNVLQGLIDQFSNLTPSIQNVTSYLVTYVSRRLDLLREPFKNVSASANDQNFKFGSDCKIIRNLIIGVFNQFCINYRANSHQIYLLVVCNIGYIIGMIVISLLYALELRQVSLKDLKEDEQSSRHIQFVQTQQLSSESHSELNSESEKQSVNSKSSGSEG